MSIKPIDLQTNLGQMHEVGKGEQARTGAIAEQQHLLEKESNEKSRQVNSKLDEAKKAEKTAIRDEEKKHQNQQQMMKKQEEERKKREELKKKMLKDEKIGNIIDVLK